MKKRRFDEGGAAELPPVTVNTKLRPSHRQQSDRAWSELRGLNNDVTDAAMLDRNRIPEAKQKYEEKAPELRQTINRIREKHRYEPEGLPRTYKKGGSVGSASRRADGIASRGKTKGKFV